MLDLRAVMFRIDLQMGDDVDTVQNFAVILHIAELNGEAIGGVVRFLFRHQQRRGMAQFAPPAHHRLALAQFARA